MTSNPKLNFSRLGIRKFIYSALLVIISTFIILYFQSQKISPASNCVAPQPHTRTKLDGQNKSTCTQHYKDEIFKFLPHPAVVPFKRKAVVMLLTSDAFSTGVADMYYINALAILFSLKHEQKTRLDDDVEVVVLVTESVSRQKRESFVVLGARLIIVRSLFYIGISDTAGRWKNCYTKLLMFQMTFYDQIMYIDTDFTILGSLTPLFKGMDAKITQFKDMDEYRKSRESYYFGAVQDYKLGSETFNAGLLLFQPSCLYYDLLISLVYKVDRYDSSMQEQGLLNYVFSKNGAGPSNVSWIDIDIRYNSQWIKERDVEYVLGSGAMHSKVWSELIDPRLYALWRGVLLRLQAYQLDLLGASDVFDIPENQSELIDDFSNQST